VARAEGSFIPPSIKADAASTAKFHWQTTCAIKEVTKETFTIYDANYALSLSVSLCLSSTASLSLSPSEVERWGRGWR